MKLLASGRWSDVYALDAGRVLRRSRDPARCPAWEPDVMRLARAGGVPVPEVLDVDGADLVLERIHGPTMLEARPEDSWLLLELHRLVHAVTAPPWLRPIGAAGDRLLHLDLHPANVILSDAGPVLLDWQGAGRGTAATDLAQTYVLLTTSFSAAAEFRSAAGPALIDGALDDVARRRLDDPAVGPEDAAVIQRLLSRRA